MHGHRQEKKTFTDLDFADDVTLFTEMLSVLVLALEVNVIDTEARPLNKIQHL